MPKRDTLKYTVLAVVLVSLAVLGILHFTSKTGSFAGAAQGISVQAFGDDAGMPQRYAFANIIVNGQENIDLAKTITSDKGEVSTADSFQIRFDPKGANITGGFRQIGNLRCYPTIGGAIASDLWLYEFNSPALTAHAPFQLSVVKNGQVAYNKQLDLMDSDTVEAGLEWQGTEISFSKLPAGTGGLDSFILFYDSSTSAYNFYKETDLRDKTFYGSNWNSISSDGSWSCPLGLGSSPAGFWANLKTQLTTVRQGSGAGSVFGASRFFIDTSNQGWWVFDSPQQAGFSTKGTLIVSEAVADVFTYRPLVAKPKIVSLDCPAQIGTKEACTITVKNEANTKGTINVKQDSTGSIVLGSDAQLSATLDAGATKVLPFSVYSTAKSSEGCITSTATSAFSGTTDSINKCFKTSGETPLPQTTATGGGTGLFVLQEENTTCTGLFEVPSHTGAGCVQQIPLWAYVVALIVVLIAFYAFMYAARQKKEMTMLPLPRRKRRR